MYKNLCLVVGLLLFGNIQAQTVSLTFTGRDSVNKYVQLNKVVVTNLTKSWQETIYWPDTVLTLTNKTGISDVQEQEMGLFSYPNPFNGTSSVLLTIPQSQEVYMAVYNITGQRVMEFSSLLEAGINHFDIGFQKPQVYFLVVSTLEGRLVQKLVNVGHSGDNYIKFRTTLPLSEEQASKIQKRQSSQPFSYGDMMEYVGYATINGNMEESQRITQAQGTSQTFSLKFDATKAILPTLNTYTASNITTTSAVSGGNITSDGGSSVTARGVCWSTSSNPTINDSHTTNGSGTGSFTSNITGLTAGRTYYVRAYATNIAGTAYGAQISFTTKTTPTLTTITASNITATSAVSGGNITSDGGSSVTDRGVCWSTSPNPTINNNHTSNGSGTGSFTSNITGLTAGRTYYIRAYATNSAGTAYGDQVSFTTKTIPTLTTITASNITDNSAVSGGNITSDGGSSVTARGVCWSTSQNPTINDSHTTDGSGIGTYTSNLNNLRGNTMYYIRAYATNSIGTAYGNQVSFITNAVVPTLTTIAVNNITDTSAVSGGHITSDGGTMVTARGVCWDTTSNPTINGNHTIDGSDTGIFTSNIVGLVYGTKYYVRAYATNSVGTAYGDQLSYTTKTIPTLTTIEASKITDTTIVSGGNITSDGGYAVTARGVCWSTLPNPTINDNHTINGSGIGSYTSNIVGLNTDTLYYVRAFATNVIGTAYGNEIVVIAKAERSALFSISAYEKAIFSPGNLQWSATNGGNISTTHAVAGNSTAEGTWRFAPNQWDTIGVNNKNISSTYTGWIDLFGWSTSGFNNKYPYLKTTITQKIVTDGGSSYGNIQGTYFDWGFYNAIYNPRTNTTYDPCVWFSLTEYSWDYLLNTRNTTSGIRYAKANVHGVNGLIIVPDNWNDSVYSLNNTNTASAAYTSNIISATDWARMETLSGCVFLPATGYRDSSYFGNIYGVGSSGYYWSSTHYNARAAYVMNLSSSNLNTSSRDGKGKGYAVRLVRSALPRITTIAVSNITDTTAVCGGNIIDEGISPITDYGICWSTSKNPTVNDNHISEGKNRESYLSNMIGLIPNTTYYVRAYATNSYGTGYGGMVSFTTAQFSVSATQKVLFSPGNLQWSATNGDNNVDIIHRVADSKAAKGIWRFAPHQWDTIGAYNRNISSTYSGWIDLFGWGTSGYDDKYPYKISGYDTTYGNGSNNISGTNYDWGLYNAIYNPSTTTTENPGAWRTLTKDEWAYLLNTRSTTSGIRYAKAKVHGVAGLIIVPDNWNVSIYSLNNTNSSNATYTSNTIDSTSWAKMENAGCVFLPAAGSRSSYDESISSGHKYWTSSWYNGNNNISAYILNVDSLYFASRSTGHSVRLVRAFIPTITTQLLSNVTDTSVISGGNVINDEGSIVTARGVCWDTIPKPTIGNNHTIDGSGTGSFTSNITGLITGKTYYVRAYATNSVGTAYGNEISFTASVLYNAQFSVSATQKVVFSPGNLQWSATNGGNTATTHEVAGNGRAAGTWRFSPYQWDTIGANNSNISSTYTGWIDLFGWGTSGYNNKYPYMTSTTNSDYGNGNNHLSGTNYDWGIYNAIFNPKTNITDAPGTWCTLTQSGWNYLLNTRSTASGIRYAKATVNGVVGLIIVPDYWSKSVYSLSSTNSLSATYTSNVINVADWAKMEAVGCVFLPAAGVRGGTSVSNVGSYGGYWLTTYRDNNSAYRLYFSSSNLSLSSYGDRYKGESVRLVRSAYPKLTTSSVSNIINISAICGGNITNDGGTPITACGVCWSTSQDPTINDNHTSDTSGIGEFTSYITGLTASTTYYVRAYATNYAGTTYGNQVSFTTLANAVIPTLTTTAVSCIANISAISGGNIINDGGVNITACGVCWSISPNPTINDNHTLYSSGIDSFTSYITGLTANTTYYVRAYATNYTGTGYGNQVSFTTTASAVIPTLTTSPVSSVTNRSAICGGNIISDGGDSVFARGVCWSTSQNPTISDSCTTDGSGMGIYTSNLIGLTSNTMYYVRAYATNSVGTAYGNEFLLTTAVIIKNAIFSVSATDSVFFSPGNLQWSATNGGNTATIHAVAGNGTATGTWRFALNQWDTIGANNSNISSTYTGWIDLFGWGTSGYNNKYPYMITTIDSLYGNGNNNISGTNYDWGIYNAIYNPQTQTIDTPGTWRTLTLSEWNYLLNNRTTSSGIRYAKGMINGVNGLIIVPDDWNSSIYSLNNTNTASAAYTSNIISATDWARMETMAGCVFMPAVGYRRTSSLGVYDVNSYGYYWSTDRYPNGKDAYYLYFSSFGLNHLTSSYRSVGRSVRLVKNVQ